MEEESKNMRSKNVKKLLEFEYGKKVFTISQGPYGYILYVREGEGKNNITYYFRLEDAIKEIIRNHPVRKKTQKTIEDLLQVNREEEIELVKNIVKEIRKGVK